MNIDNKAIREFRVKVMAFLALKKTLTIVTVWALLWGTVVIVLRAAVGVPRLPLLVGGIGLILAIGIAIVLALRQMPTRTAVRASLDKHSGSGGLMMAAETVELGSWQAQMPPVRSPRLHWRGGVPLARFAGAVLFVCISFLIPQRFVDIAKAQPLDISEEVKQLEEGIDVLEEEEIIEVTQAETLEKKLEQLQEEATGEDPVKTWEALDHIKDTLSKESMEAAQESLSETEQLTAAETLSEALRKDGAEMDAELLKEAMETLSGLVKEAAKENALLAENLPQLKENAGLKGAEISLTPEQLKAISEALRLAKGDISERLAKLLEANLIDLKTLAACEKLGQCNSDGLAAFLAENADSASVSDCLGGWCRSAVEGPGRGGISRGRGDAPMTWTDGTTEEGAKFKAEALPLSDIASIEDSKMMGVSMAAPTIEKSGVPSKTGGLNGAQAGGGSSVTQTILPRHKGAVKRYFERP